MSNNLRFYTEALSQDTEIAQPNNPDEIIEGWGFKPPVDYLEFMRQFVAGEGPIGENGYLQLYPLEELKSINADYVLVMEQIPSYFLFGKDTADTGFAFHKINGTYHAFGLMSDFRTDILEFCGNSLTEFMQYLYNQ